MKPPVQRVLISTPQRCFGCVEPRLLSPLVFSRRVPLSYARRLCMCECARVHGSHLHGARPSRQLIQLPQLLRWNDALSSENVQVPLAHCCRRTFSPSPLTLLLPPSSLSRALQCGAEAPLRPGAPGKRCAFLRIERKRMRSQVSCAAYLYVVAAGYSTRIYTFL